MKRLLRYILLLIACIFCGWTQAVLPQNKVLRNDIRTLRTEQAGALIAMPVLTLHSQDRVSSTAFNIATSFGNPLTGFSKTNLWSRTKKITG